MYKYIQNVDVLKKAVHMCSFKYVMMSIMKETKRLIANTIHAVF